MSTRDIESQALHPQHSKGGMRRVTLVIVLSVILGLIGSTVFAFVEPRVGNNLKTGALTHTMQILATSQRQPAPTMFPTSTPSPAPISPFPTLLRSQIAVLQANDRFLYHGNIGLPEVALTFDDGPNPYYTPQVLAILQRYSIRATFFCIGRQVAAYPDLVRQEYAAGNVVGNHSWSHPDLPLLSSSDISMQINTTSDAIQRAIGLRPTFFRPPYGALSAQALTQINSFGLTTVIWNDEAHDWLRPGVNAITSRILYLAGYGAIILLHDGGGNRSQTVAALPSIIEGLQQQGYQFVTLQQMVDDLHKHSVASPTPTTGSTPTVSPVPVSPNKPHPSA